MPKEKRHRAQFKFKVALKAAGSSKTLCQLVSEYKLHARQISKWKHQLLGKEDRKGPVFSVRLQPGNCESKKLSSPNAE